MVFFVTCAEPVNCPGCNGSLSVIGSRNRTMLDDDRNRVVFRIRRLHCKPCRRIHHELPDRLVPYKRYGSGVIEGVLDEPDRAVVAVESSTIARWLSWFESVASHWIAVLASLASNLAVMLSSNSSQTAHERIGQVVGTRAGWLARIVRPVANSNFCTYPFCLV
jgi:hypothetical protein